MIEAQLQPEYGEPCNPYDLFEGREFAISVRKVGEWNNYDLCSFVGERTPIRISGNPMKKNQEDMNKILEYLNSGPRNLSAFDYKDWDDEVNDKVMAVIRNTVPEQRIVNEIMGGVSSAPSKPNPVQQSAPSTSSQMLEEVSNTKVGGQTQREVPTENTSSSSATSLDDLYADL